MNALDAVLTRYDKLHNYNVHYFGKMRAQFFDGIMQDHHRRHLLIAMLKSELWPFLYSQLRVANGDLCIDLDWDNKNKNVLIYYQTIRKS